MLGVSAVLGWRHWHSLRAAASVAATNAIADKAGAASGQTNAAAAATMATGGVPPGAMQTRTAGQPQKRAWDYTYFASLKDAAPGGPIRFELAEGVFADGTIRHLERTNDEVIYVSGELTAPEPGRFFFQKQTLPGKQGDFAGGGGISRQQNRVADRAERAGRKIRIGETPSGRSDVPGDASA